MGTAIGLMVLSWGTCVLITGGAAALYAGGRAIVGASERGHCEAVSEDIGHIGDEARRAADRLSEVYLSELKTLLDDHPRR